MAKPYASEMAHLAATFRWANDVDISSIRCAIRTAVGAPLLAIGSGGSLTAANVLADIHMRFTGRLSAVATPLAAMSAPVKEAVSIWLLSSGGTNVDVLAVAEQFLRIEPFQLAVMCARADSPLVSLSRQHGYADLLLYPSPAGKDGFLATNSLLLFVALLARSYSVEFGEASSWDSSRESVNALLSNQSSELQRWGELTSRLWRRATTIVLHGPSTRAGAIDIESKFIEAGLGNVQVADYRNFAHGRHHWVAKHADTSGVLALIAEDDRLLAERTLDLLPKAVPQARLEFEGSHVAALLNALIAALWVTGWAGVARGIDPGKPGVPDFGRKLYNLSIPRLTTHVRSFGLSARDEAAIRRKVGVDIRRLDELGQLSTWRESLDKFRERIKTPIFAGILFDYDGTLVDTRFRFSPIITELADELKRIIESGAQVAIATGRGSSVLRDLQTRLPRSLWGGITIGYYNGAHISSLSDAGPDRSEDVCAALAEIAERLRCQPELAQTAKQTNRRYQITLEPKREMPENRLWDLAHEVLLETARFDVTITRSSHSIDILAPGVSKLNVVRHLRSGCESMPILCIGDRGRWPGNDYELLREPYSLGVDQINADPTTCWNLAEPGQRGVAATIEYLRALNIDKGGVRFDAAALR